MVIIAVVFFNRCMAQHPNDNPQASKILLPNGWSLTPAGRSLPLGDLPLNMQLSPSGNLLAITNNGYSNQTIQLVDAKNEKILDEKTIGKAWYGLKFSSDGKKLYASGGNDNIILCYRIAHNKLAKADTIRLGQAWPKQKISPAGIDIDDAAAKLYAVTKEDSAVYVVDLKTKRVLAKTKLASEAYDCILSADKKQLYVSLWGANAVSVYDIQKKSIVGNISVGSHPNEMIRSKNGHYLFVANANDNSVSVIDCIKQKPVEGINAALYPTHLTGSTTNSLTLSPDEKTLYIANADNNCLAVFDVSIPGKSISKGFIPTGWYPTSVRSAGNKIFVANGKGFSSLPNPNGPQPAKNPFANDTASARDQYIGSLLKATLSIVDVPSAQQLKNYTQEVYANTPFKPDVSLKTTGSNPIPLNKGEKSPIKYVFYIIKENRTYDQVLGDMKEGNGDPTLCLFPEKISPNHHALAKTFVLLDNFYVDAEVSCDGHNWSTAAYATDYVEKTWPTLYGKRGGTYDYEGTREVAYPKEGFLWNYCQRAGVSYRSYGEFVSNGKANDKSLDGHICAAYEGFNLSYKDVDRYKVWQHDFDSLLSKNGLPSLSIIRLPNDHTSGQRKGMPTPFAAVADNDLALGMMVQHISESPVWKESAIFVLEDDAQNGPDHVDAHRSPAFIISPYIKRNAVNHAMYSTSGMLRTIELILGLPPMSQYDAGALPMYGCFTATPDLTTYKALPASISLDEQNTASNESAKQSANFDLAKEDAVPDLELNQVIWKYVKGENSEMPAPIRSAFVMTQKNRKSNDQ